MTSDSQATKGVRGKALDWLELIAATLLAFATVATAWSGYEATRWAGEATKASASANAARIAGARQAALANTQRQVDIALFTEWVGGFARGDTFLLEFYDRRFREEFKPALEAWLATMPLQNEDAPLSPFVMPEYVLAADEEAARQDEIAERKVAESRRNIQRQSNYVLAAVLFATALFFAGMSARLESRPLRIILLSFGLLVFLGAITWVATMPVTVGV